MVKWLTLTALIGMLHWFFGNLYEAIVFSPNWVLDSPAQLAHMHALFTRTSPTTYFVPISFLAPVLGWVAHACNRVPAATSGFRRATALALLATALNVLIVATIVTVLFADDYRSHSDGELYALCVRWNVLNTARMVLCAATAATLFGVFRKLDRTPA